MNDSYCCDNCRDGLLDAIAITEAFVRGDIKAVDALMTQVGPVDKMAKGGLVSGFARLVASLAAGNDLIEASNDGIMTNPDIDRIFQVLTRCRESVALA